MAANHATNYSYKNCSFCIINYFEISSTVIDTPRYEISNPCVGICGWWWWWWLWNDYVNEKTDYGPFGPILTILAAKNGKIKNEVVQNPNFNLL